MDINALHIEQLPQNAPIPYHLLLLADETVESIDRYIFASKIYGVKENEKLIAAYALCMLNKNMVEVKNIAVAKEFQGKGIGTLLLQDAEVRAKAEGFKSLIIGTGDSSFQQIKLYKRLGFEEFDVKRNFFFHNYPYPIVENGIMLRDMIMFKKDL